MIELFEFNGDYGDFAQVEPFLPAFLEVFAEVQARPGFAYNDSFVGRIPAIANKAHRGPNSGTHEDSAIYMLQGLKRKREQEARIAELLADGYEHIDTLDQRTRFAHIVLYPTRRMGGEWAEYRDARLVPDANDQPRAVLPKGKRTNGYSVNGRRVLARREV
jgi:hypothetical protein